MYTFFTLFLISALAIVFMLMNKLREIEGKKSFVSIGSHLDESIRHKIILLRKAVVEFPRHFSREAFYAFVQNSVLLFRKLRAKIYPHIAHIVDAVKGKDIPKNKGAASFFLVHIQEHKEKMEKAEGGEKKESL